MDKRAISKERERQRYYRSARSIVRKALSEYTKDFEDDLKRCQTAQQMAALAEKPLKSERIAKAMKQIYAPVGKHFGEQTYKQLLPTSKSIKFTPNVQGLTTPVTLGGEVRPAIGLTPKPTLPGMVTPVTDDYWFAWAERMVKGTLGNRITWITNTTEDVFKSTVDRIAWKGFEDGKGVDAIAREIMKDLKITEKYRAERIARTEVIGASNMASQAGAQATGLELEKEWISFIDDKTRDSHRDINGKKIPMDEEFHLSTGGILEVPGDPAGEAEDVINCRCTVGYGVKDSEYNWGRNI
jgi:hypothetical protein